MISTIIEAYLKAIDQATFQKLMNHLLWLEGYAFLGSPGAVVGRNKTSPGTPDSFFEDGDKYIFCEYTTQERLVGSGGLLKKLKADIDHCHLRQIQNQETGDIKIARHIISKESGLPTARQPGQVSPTPLAHAIATHPAHIQSKGKSQTRPH